MPIHPPPAASRPRALGSMFSPPPLVIHRGDCGQQRSGHMAEVLAIIAIRQLNPQIMLRSCCDHAATVTRRYGSSGSARGESW